MQSSFQRILTGASVFAVTTLVATAGYTLAGWSLLDAFYMTIITVFGVGYGEVKPLETPEIRIFTIGVIIAGTSAAVYAVGGFVQAITEGEIQQALGARRMSRDIERLENHVILCGFGRIGQLLARQLAEAGQTFAIVDASPERVEQAIALNYLVLDGNATDEAVLEKAGIDRAKVLATVLPDDAANVFITLTARGLNPNLVIVARGEFPSTEKKLLLAGADQVVSPAAIGAQRIAQIINHPAALNFLAEDEGRSNLNELLARIDVKLDELVIEADSPLVDRTVGDIEVRGRGTFIVVALCIANGETLIHPPHEQPLRAGDTVIVMGHQGDIPRFARHYALKRQLRYRGVQI